MHKAVVESDWHEHNHRSEIEEIARPGSWLMLRHRGNDWHILLGIGWIKKGHGSATESSGSTQGEEDEHKQESHHSEGHSQSGKSLELLCLQVLSHVLNYNIGVHDDKDAMGCQMLTGFNNRKVDECNQHGHN